MELTSTRLFSKLLWGYNEIKAINTCNNSGLLWNIMG